MSKAICVVIENESFYKKELAVERIQQLIAAYKPGSFLNEKDLSFCTSLFLKHPNFQEKIGVGIHKVEVRLDPEFKKKNFHIHRLDGSITDISWRKCLGAIK